MAKNRSARYLTVHNEHHTVRRNSGLLSGGPFNREMIAERTEETQSVLLLPVTGPPFMALGWPAMLGVTIWKMIQAQVGFQIVPFDPISEGWLAADTALPLSHEAGTQTSALWSEHLMWN